MSVLQPFVAPEPGQKPLRVILRGVLRTLFKPLVRPPMPIAGQRWILRALTLPTLQAKAVVRSAGMLAGRPCEWHRPLVSGGQVLLYLHGGAFMIGSPATHRALCSTLARRGGFDVCALDYRLAPEHPFPAALEDVEAAYRALLEQGFAPEQIALAGDSAGGNLSLTGCLRIVEKGLPAPAALVCLSPVTDLLGEHLHAPEGGDPMINLPWMEQAGRLYIPDGTPRDLPQLSPLYGDLGALPALLLQVGEDEVLRNDSLRLAQAASEQGAVVQLERYPQMWHVFQAHVGLLHIADFAVDRIVEFLRGRGW